MKRLKKLSRKIASKTFSSNTKSGASAVTKVYSERLNTLRSVEGIFYNLSNNFLEMAKAMDATTTTLEETKDSLKQQISEKQRADEEYSLEKKSNKEKLFSKVVTIGGDSSSSLFDQIAQSLQTIVDVLSVSASSLDLPDVDKGKGKGKPSGRERTKNARTKAEEAAKKRGAPKEEIKKAGQKAAEKAAQREAAKKAEQKVAQQVARKAALQIAGRGLGVAAKVAGTVAAPLGLAMGAYEASEYLKETGYGDRMAKGEGGRAEKAFREKKTDFSSQPLTADEAKSILDGNNPRDIEAFGGKERLEKIAGLQKPPIAATTQYNHKDTGVGGGRTTMKDDPRRTDFVKAEVSTVVKSTFTPSQLKWLGDADPTDPIILSRMPPPEPGEVGGPPLEAPKPVVQVAKPTPAPVPAVAEPTSKEKVVPPVVAAEKKPAPSDTKPVKISAQQGKQAMLKALDQYKVQDPTARAAIMAQVGHESGNFTTLSENLNYSSSGLMSIFKKYFPDTSTADQYAKNPVKIADRVYGGRMGNAPEGSGEGFKYRGRGFIQLTGKSNYQKFGVLNNPDSVSEVDTAADTAMKYMLNYKGDWSDVVKVTKYVNGGTIGLKDRQDHYAAYLNDPSITTPQIMTTTPSTGVQTAMASADVGSAKKQQSSQTTYNINNSTSTAIKVGAPQGSSTTIARPVGTA